MTSINATIRQAQHGAATIAYAVVGPKAAEAPTLCLIASTGRGPEDFTAMAQYLAAKGVRVVLPWPRGVGESRGETGDIDFHDLAGDALATLEAEAGSGGAFMAGHAYGCWIARAAAQARPDLISGLILIAAGAGSWPVELSRAIEVAMDSDRARQDRLDALRLAFFADGQDPSHWLTGWHPDLVAMQRAARQRTDRASWWPSGIAPILDIIGLADPFRPEGDLEFYVRELGPRVHLRTIEGASHALPDEKPDETARGILDWLHAQKEIQTAATAGAVS